MANVLAVFGGAELEKLQEVSEDLEEILLNIAYNGEAGNRQYIEASQKYMEKEYGQWMVSLANDVTNDPYTAESKIGMMVASVISAYDGLQGILFTKDLRTKDSVQEVEEDAKDLLYEYLIFPEDMKEEDFCNANHL